MLKRKKEEVDLNKWFSIIHDDLYYIRNSMNKAKKNNSHDTYEQLKGLRDAILLDACSGIAYIYNNKLYETLTDIANEVDGEVECDVIRVMNVDYLLQFINQILE